MAEKEIRIIATDFDHNGKPDAVVIEFYSDKKIDYAVQAIDKDEDGFSKIVSHGLDVNNDGKLDDLDTAVLKDLANIALRIQ